MKISPKSIILSPGRSREPSQILRSSSLSRRLRSNGSIKGGQASPMFPAIGKKRGCALENPEPSSPKVTCIGQVRVKTKKQGKKIRARSKRRGEVGFRKMDHNSTMAATPSTNNLDMGSHQDYNKGHFLHGSSHHHQQNQQQECRKWVHFPVTICEALRAFGAELNCFLPCRSSCMANQREKVEKAAGSDEESNRSGNGSSCGAVFARWLVAVQEEVGKERNIELVVGEEDRRGSTEMRSSQKRHIFEGTDINEFKGEKMGEEEATVSICIPPKNALLLMRCRSDPVKMAALANRFWESPAPQDEEEEDMDENGEKVEEAHSTIDEDEMGELYRKSLSCEAAEGQQIPAAEAEDEPETESALDGGEAEEQENQERNPLIDNLEEQRNFEYQGNEIENQPESAQESSSENFADPEKVECEENAPISPENEANPEEETDPKAESENGREDIDETILNQQECSENKEKTAEAQAISEETEEEETGACQRSEPGSQDSQERAGVGSNEKESQPKLLPDCLLLMMCEPKLSMEVSKETWVCSTDFIRWLPVTLPPANKKKDSCGDEPKRRISIDSKPSKQLLKPPKSSCSFPVVPPIAVSAVAAAAAQASSGASRATMIEQKLIGGKGREPFVLTRCKSEPMRSAAKVPPGACFWKNRNLEPATLGVGAAGVGF